MIQRRLRLVLRPSIGATQTRLWSLGFRNRKIVSRATVNAPSMAMTIQKSGGDSRFEIVRPGLSIQFQRGARVAGVARRRTYFTRKSNNSAGKRQLPSPRPHITNTYAHLEHLPFSAREPRGLAGDSLPHHATVCAVEFGRKQIRAVGIAPFAIRPLLLRRRVIETVPSAHCASNRLVGSSNLSGRVDFTLGPFRSHR
jgi:hypothetical protein